MTQQSSETKAEYISGMFARIAHRYDLVNKLMTFGRDAWWRRLAASLAKPPPGGRAIDVATGTADLAIELAKRTGLVIGLDFCPQMAARGKAKTLRKALGQKIEFVLADALALPFRDNSFDCATIGFGMRNLESIVRGLTELRRVIKPGGRVVCLELTKPPSRVIEPFYRLYLHKVIPFLGQQISGDSNAYGYLSNSINEFPTADELKVSMEEAGLRQPTYRRLNLGTIAVHVGLK